MKTKAEQGIELAGLTGSDVDIARMMTMMVPNGVMARICESMVAAVRQAKPSLSSDPDRVDPVVGMSPNTAASVMATLAKGAVSPAELLTDPFIAGGVSTGLQYDYVKDVEAMKMLKDAAGVLGVWHVGRRGK